MKKRILSIILTFILVVLALSVSSFAAGETDGRIFITQSDGGETVASKTFNIYKIFDATTTGEGTNKAISYQWYIPVGETESPYYDFFYTDWNGDGVLLDPATGDSQERAAQYMRGLSTDDLIILSSKIYAYIDSKSITPTQTQTAGDTAVQVKFENLEYGYYLIYDATIDPEVRSAVILTSVAPASTVKLKSEKPAISKVFNGSNKVGSVTIGDQIVYTITTIVPDHAYFTDSASYIYTVTDEVPADLTLDEASITVAKEGVALVSGADYTLTVAGQAITVKYNNILSYTKGEKLTITYNTVASDSATASSSSRNTAVLTYSNDPTDAASTGEVSSFTNVYTYYFDLTKVSSANYNTVLTGAKFKLYRVIEGVETPLNLTGSNGVYKVQGGSANDLEMTVDNSGKLVIEGLGAGNYVLMETVAPDGYKLPLDPFEFTIHNDFSTDGSNILDGITINNISTTNTFGEMIDASGNVATHTVSAKITNEAGTALPETGGMGTTAFTIGGILLIAIALGFSSVRRKSNA